MIFRQLAPALLILAIAKGETPEEARQKLAETYFKGDGWELEYDLFKNGKKGAAFSLNVTKGRKFASASFRIVQDDNSAQLGFGFYPVAIGAEPSTYFSLKGGVIGLNLGNDIATLMKPFAREEHKANPVFFNPEGILAPSGKFELRGTYSTNGKKPYPWGPQILETIERVERKDNTVIFHGRNDEVIRFDSNTGLLVEHRFATGEKKTMILKSKKKLTEFKPNLHGLKGPVSDDEELVNMAKSGFGMQHSLVILLASSALQDMDDKQREQTLAEHRTNLLAHYRKVDARQPYLCDPMGVGAVIAGSTKRAFDGLEKRIAAAGKDVPAELRRLGPGVMDEILPVIPKMAQMLSKVPLYGISAEKFQPNDRPLIESILDAEKRAIIRVLVERQTKKELAERIGDK